MRRLFLLLLLLPGLASARTPEVVVSIGPLHSIVAAVMQDVAAPELLVPAGASPHSYALRPSDARALAGADLVVWVGESLERFLEKPLHSLAADARRLEIETLPDLTLLKPRTGVAWEGHENEHHDHAAEDHEHHSENIDAHLWLDPTNAVVIAQAVATELAELDPAHAERYRANARRFAERIATTDASLRKDLARVRATPYVVFHDAYHYFEHRYALNNVGAITLSPDRPPGARRLAEINARIKDLDAVCVFREPQFKPSLAEAAVRGTNAKLGELDPIGASLTPGAEYYFQLLEGMRANLLDCLEQ